MLRCPRGHAFDRARGGYWNLLQPQDRRSSRPGDSDAAVQARGRWLARGFADGLSDALARVAAPSAGKIVVDLGCGEGFFARRLFQHGGATVCGIDLSAAAVRMAARAWPEATWIVANADRFIPLLDSSCDLALSLFGRRPTAELARVLRPNGRVVVAVPAADDLVELREAAQGRAELRDRAPRAIEELGSAFQLAERRSWRDRARLDRAAIEDALAMSYRGARHAERERLIGVLQLDVTLSAEILVLERG